MKLRWRSASIVWLTPVLWLAAFLRLHDLGEKSLWTDEGWSVFGARLSFLDTFYFLLANDPHPPLYHFIQKISIPLGAGEFVVRWPAAMFGILGVAVIARLGREWMGRRAGVLAALLLALSPYAIWYGQEARTYTLFMLLNNGALWGFSRLVNGRAWNIRVAVAFVFVSAALYVSHYFGLYAALVQFVYLFITFKRNYRLLRVWLALQIVAAIPIGLWVIALYRFGVNFGIGWIPRPEWDATWLTLQQFVLGNGEIFGWAMIAFAAAAAIGWWAARQKNWSLLTLLWALLPPLMTFAISLRKPLYVDRYLIGSLPPLLLAITAGLSAVFHRNRWAGYICAALLLGVMAIEAPRMLDNSKEDWRAATDYIRAHSQPDDGLVMRSIYYLSMNYYYKGPLKVESMDAGWQAGAVSALQGHRVWVIYRGGLGRNYAEDSIQTAAFYSDEEDVNTRDWLMQADSYLIEARDYSGVVVLLYDFSARGQPPQSAIANAAWAVCPFATRPLSCPAKRNVPCPDIGRATDASRLRRSG